MHLFFASLPLALRDYMLPCLSKQLFGVECPGCGFQRSLVLLLEFDFGAAFYMYPAIYTIIPLAGVLLMDAFYKIRYVDKIIIVLSFLSVGLILANYILKII